MSRDRGIYHKKQFLYETVRDGIVEIIRSRHMKAHDAIPSESRIAESYSVSRMTGKLALKSLEDAGIIYRRDRRGSFLAEGFEKRLLEFERVRTLDKSAPRSVALVIPVLDFYVGSIVNSINLEAEKRGIRVILRVTDENTHKEDRILAELSQLPYIQGIILFPTDRQGFDGELLRLKLNRYPVVLIDRTFGAVSFDSVCHAHYQGAHDITSYLISKGHRNIGYASRALKTTQSREERYQGYLHALMEGEVPARKEYIWIVDEAIHSDRGRHVLDSQALVDLQEFLGANREITAVVCCDDYVATELYYAAAGMGMNIPDDISIAGFGDNRVLRFLPIRLSTVRQPVDSMAEHAVECLLSRMDDPDRDYCNIVIETDIVNRDSIADISKSMSARPLP